MANAPEYFDSEEEELRIKLDGIVADKAEVSARLHLLQKDDSSETTT